MNVLDYPTIVIPVTFADKQTHLVDSKFQTLTELDRENMGICESILFLKNYPVYLFASAIKLRPNVLMIPTSMMEHQPPYS
jgi:hypothetical protein